MSSSTLPRMHRPIISLLIAVVLSIGPHATSEIRADSQDLDETRLAARLKATIDITGRRVLSTDRHSPWKICHGIMGMGADFQILDDANGQMTTAVEYICRKAQTGGQRIFVATSTGLEPVEAATMQGHPDQFLAIFAESGVPVDTRIDVAGNSFSVRDLITRAKSDAYLGQEASWTIIAIAYYESTDSHRTNQFGQHLTLENLVAYEVQVDPHTDVGATHEWHLNLRN